MKFVSEIFGFDSRFKTSGSIYRSKYICPFQDQSQQCDPVNKKSNLTDDQGNKILEHQTGACSCFYKNSDEDVFNPTIICPFRFLEKNNDNNVIVFEKIKQFFYPDKEIGFVKEVGLGHFGQADYMIAIFDNNKKIIDFGHCEFQADATTGTRGIVECVRDFYQNVDIHRNYSYGLNTKATIKGFSLQMIDKGFLFHKLKKPSIWIMQDNLINKFKKMFNVVLKEVTEYDEKDNNNIYIIETKLYQNNIEKKFNLLTDKVYSTNSNEIQNALSNKEIIPEKKILNSIIKKYESNHFF